MKFIRVLGLVTVAVLLSTALLGPSAASATKLYKYTTPSANDPLGVGTVIKAKSEGSVTFKDTEEDLILDTCTSMEGEGIIEKDEGTPRGKATLFTFSNCSHTLHTLIVGELEIKHIAGTTNGTVISNGTQATFQSTVFGISCNANTGAGTVLGTLTGAKSSSGKAVIDINSVFPVSFFCGGDIRLSGTGVVTSPTGLTVEAS